MRATRSLGDHDHGMTGHCGVSGKFNDGFFTRVSVIVSIRYAEMQPSFVPSSDGLVEVVVKGWREHRPAPLSEKVSAEEHSDSSAESKVTMQLWSLLV